MGARGRANALDARVAALTHGVPFLSAAEFAAIVADPARRVVVVDAREAEEFAVSRIRGAVRGSDAVDAAGVDIVVYCTVGVRSGIVARGMRGGATVWNYSLLRHVWGGGEMEGRGGHSFVRKYAALFPEGWAVEWFGVRVAACRGLSWVPAIFAAAARWALWRLRALAATQGGEG